MILRHTGLTWMVLDGATVRELMGSAGHRRYRYANTLTGTP
jgi:hypothetical protein